MFCFLSDFGCFGWFRFVCRLDGKHLLLYGENGSGKSSVFWGDGSKGKDAYVLEYDEASDEYYFKKVEKNRPIVKKISRDQTQISVK